MPEFAPKVLPYVEKMEKAQRIVKAASFRTDSKLALRELCEALVELSGALLEREQESPAK